MKSVLPFSVPEGLTATGSTFFITQAVGARPMSLETTCSDTDPATWRRRRWIRDEVFMVQDATPQSESNPRRNRSRH